MQKILDTIGQNISFHRKARGLSQEDLSLQSGVPRSTIAGIEGGSANPTLKNMLLISNALQISLQEMTSIPRTQARFVPKDAIETLIKSKGAVVIRKMLPDPVPGMEIDYVTLKPNTRVKGVPHMKGSKEYTICTSGQVSVFVEGENFLCRPGDCLTFLGDQAHSYYNPEDSPSEFVAVVILAPSGV